jgi:hypothetical protein
MTFGVLAVLVTAGSAAAHRLDAEYRVLPGKLVRVESWFETGDSPKGAQVQVFRESGELLVQGGLSSQGLFLFAYEEAEPLKVVIDTRDHRKELAIAAADLVAPAGEKGTTPTDGPPLADRGSPATVRDVLSGFALVLAAAALWLSWRNARQLRDVKSAGSPPAHHPRNEGPLR